MSLARAVLLYDGDCGFCTAAAHTFARRLHSRAQTRPWQPEDELTHGVTPAEAEAEIHFVTIHGSVLGGADAVLAWWRTSPGPWALVGRVLQLPGLVQLSRLGYRIIARNRHALPGGTAACAIDPRVAHGLQG